MGELLQPRHLFVASRTFGDFHPLQGCSCLVHLQKSRLCAVAFIALYRSVWWLGSQCRARFH